MKLAVLLATLAGAAIAIQATVNVAAARNLGLATLISVSGFATGFTGLAFAFACAEIATHTHAPPVRHPAAGSGLP